MNKVTDTRAIMLYLEKDVGYERTKDKSTSKIKTEIIPTPCHPLTLGI